MEKVRKPFPTVWDIVALFAIILAAQLVGGAVVAAIFGMAAVKSHTALLVSYAVSMALAIIFAFVYRYGRKAVGKALVERPKWINPILLVAGIVVITAVSLVEEPLLNLLPEKYMDMLNDNIGTGAAGLIMTVVLAPVCEEVLFRGVLLQSIRSRWGAAAGIVGSAVLFGAIHGIPQQVINAFFIGLVLGYVYVKTESIITVILLHAVNNGISFLMMTLYPDQNITLRELLNNDRTYWLVYIIAAVVVVVTVASVWIYESRGCACACRKDNNKPADSVN